MAVPAEILAKPGSLTSAEFALVRGHAEAGFLVLESGNVEAPLAELVYQHHERCDGSGYPRGLTGETMLIGAKILAVADVVEAMLSHRPYRASLGVEAALGEIERGSGTLYDARVVEACERLFREHGFEFKTADRAS
jgi:HD-GYP domain-containing protein (c-di-GMP phosphodiesterase class II)